MVTIYVRPAVAVQRHFQVILSDQQLLSPAGGSSAYPAKVNGWENVTTSLNDRMFILVLVEIPCGDCAAAAAGHLMSLTMRSGRR